MSIAAATLGALALAATATAAALWPARDATALAHLHTELPDGHPHLSDARRADDGWRHGHRYTVDALHPHGPVPVTAGRTAP